MSVILDIGAGNLIFAETLIRNNSQKVPLKIFCGEPNWNNFQRAIFKFKIYSPNEINSLIAKNKSGVYRINSKYDDFAFEDNSLDMICINTPHPLTPPIGIEKEINRCLKQKGVVFYGHSADMNYLNLSSDFELICAVNYVKISFSSWLDGYKQNISDFTLKFPSHLPNIVTPSQVILSNMIELLCREKNQNIKRSGYVYNNVNLNPNFKVYLRVK